MNSSWNQLDPYHADAATSVEVTTTGWLVSMEIGNNVTRTRGPSKACKRLGKVRHLKTFMCKQCQANTERALANVRPLYAGRTWKVRLGCVDASRDNPRLTPELFSVCDGDRMSLQAWGWGQHVRRQQRTCILNGHSGTNQPSTICLTRLVLEKRLP